MLEDWTSSFWEQCVEFYALEPWGSEVDDMRHGMLCATVIAPHMKRGVTPDPRHYMLRPPEPPELTPEQTAAYFKAALGSGTKPKKTD
jgi:hypothetical protein